MRNVENKIQKILLEEKKKHNQHIYAHVKRDMNVCSIVSNSFFFFITINVCFRSIAIFEQTSTKTVYSPVETVILAWSLNSFEENAIKLCGMSPTHTPFRLLLFSIAAKSIKTQQKYLEGVQFQKW